jgi:hypothetical protein
LNFGWTVNQRKTGHYYYYYYFGYDGIGGGGEGQFRENMNEKTAYASLYINNPYFDCAYSYNSLTSELFDFFMEIDDRKEFKNHYISGSLHLNKDKNKYVNDLGFKLNYAKYMNYAIIPQWINLNANWEDVSWITAFKNDNLEMIIYGSFLNRQISFEASRYSKIFDDYPVFNGSCVNHTKLFKKGYELETEVYIIKNREVNWKIAYAYSQNDMDFKNDTAAIIYYADTVLRNSFQFITNTFTYKNFQIHFGFESKKGYDIELYNSSIAVVEPIVKNMYRQIVGISSNGIPIVEHIQDFNHNITNTDYSIFKNLSVDYRFENIFKSSIDMTVGIKYAKIRRLYRFVNDVELYYWQYQKPSFCNTIGFTLNFSLK